MAEMAVVPHGAHVDGMEMPDLAFFADITAVAMSRPPCILANLLRDVISIIPNNPLTAAGPYVFHGEVTRRVDLLA